MALSTPTRSVYIRTNKNELNMIGNSDISGSKINDKNLNVLSSTQKMSFKVGFFTFKASLAFT